MKKCKALILLLFIAATANSQSFQPGWHIVQKKAVYTILQASYMDATANGYAEKVDPNDLVMASSEAVLAFDQKDGLTYCFDPYGRTVVFKGDSSLKRATAAPGASVGYIIKDIERLEGGDLKEGHFVWIVGQDLARNTIKIELADNQVLEIPKDSIQLLTKTIRSNAKKDDNFRVVLDF